MWDCSDALPLLLLNVLSSLWGSGHAILPSTRLMQVVRCFDNHETAREPCTAAESTEESKTIVFIPFVEWNKLLALKKLVGRMGWDRLVPSWKIVVTIDHLWQCDHIAVLLVTLWPWKNLPWLCTIQVAALKYSNYWIFLVVSLVWHSHRC